MSNLRSFVEKIHYDGQRDYSRRHGNIRYLDDSPLKRPFAMPASQRIIAIVIIAIAVVIAFMLVNTFVISKFKESADAEKAITTNLQREPSLNTLPIMVNYLGLDDASIKASFDEAGFVYYDASQTNENTNLLLYKLPSDMTVPEATALYMKGVGSLTAQEASKLLNGSWSFSADRSSGTSMVVRYADFSTGDPQIAVQNAIAKEGFPAANVTESGVDDSGNTFSTGTAESTVGTCNWRISAIKLSEMYSISGLPSDACYVGIRVATT